MRFLRLAKKLLCATGKQIENDKVGEINIARINLQVHNSCFCCICALHVLENNLNAH